MFGKKCLGGPTSSKYQESQLSDSDEGEYEARLEEEVARRQLAKSNQALSKKNNQNYLLSSNNKLIKMLSINKNKRHSQPNIALSIPEMPTPRVKLALLIGICYKGTPIEMKNPIKDIYKMRDFLLGKHYDPQNITILTDETENKPTSPNIIAAIANIMLRAHNMNACEVFIHYSGHATIMFDKDGNEITRPDETIVPLDYQNNKLITKYQLNGLLSQKPEKCRLLCIFDCCHDETLLDLRYSYKDTPASSVINIVENGRTLINSKALCITGCLNMIEDSKSVKAGAWFGAITAGFIACYKEGITCQQLLKEMRKFMGGEKFMQIPILSSADPITEVSTFI